MVVDGAIERTASKPSPSVVRRDPPHVAPMGDATLATASSHRISR